MRNQALSTVLFTLLLVGGASRSNAAVYNESGGLVVMEMENTESPLDLWQEQTSLSGYTGSGYLQFLGNTYETGPATSPLEYTFKINQAGLYYLQLHCAKEIHDGRTDVANDAYVRVEGDYSAGPGPYDSHGDNASLSLLQSDTKYYGGAVDSWKWESGANNLDPGGDTNKRNAVYDFKAGETYKLVISGRSKFFRINRIMFRHISVSESAAQNIGNPESGLVGDTDLVYDATTDFPTINAGEVTYYKDTTRNALAIDASVVADRGKFARAQRTFDGPADNYDVTITALRELDGESTYRFLVNGTIAGTVQNGTTDTDYAPQEHTFQNISIPAGATIAVESNTDSNEQVTEGDGFAWARGRWTQVELSESAGTPEPDGSVTSLTLVDADTDQDIGPLNDGDTLYLGLLPTTNLNVRANTFPTTVGSVRFALDGNANYKTESVAPYALEGDLDGDYNPWTPALGAHTITATPYTEASGAGTAGTALTVAFTVEADDPGFPVVDAGSNRFVFLPTNSVNLTGTATDNGTVASNVWTQRSGPNTATLGGADTLNLIASGLIRGAYIFRLTATDNEGYSAFDEVTVSVVPEGSGNALITGELKKWHKVTFSWSGLTTSETAATNPFSDYRLNATFSHADSGKSYTVPGFFAADGDAAETSAVSGDVWRAHFAPDEVGQWSYTVSFRTGSDIAVDTAAGAGVSAGFFDGDSGVFDIAATDKTGRDLRGKGRLEYVGKHHLQFAETDEYFLKVGADAPENFLAYDDFDATPNDQDNQPNLRKSWSPHAGDYHAATAAPFTWQGGKGTEILGAVRYLSQKGMNVFSFLTFSLDGDDDNVFPHRLKVSVPAYEAVADNGRWAHANGVYHDRFDVSKMAQWERVFEYGGLMGMYLHFKTQETENDQRMDGGALGRERKLYYRELVARFGHHLALNWNLGEENTNTEAQQRAFAQWFYDNDPYRHNVVLHTYPAQKDAVYTPLLGAASKLTGLSLQTNQEDFSNVFPDTLTWVQNSAGAGVPWVVACDEPGEAAHALRPAGDEGSSWTDGRKNALWGNVMAGGAGLEFYFGYQHANSDLTCQDYRSRDGFWDICRYMLEFFENNTVPFWDMANEDSLVSHADAWCLRKTGESYVVYLKSGATTTLDLAGASGVLEVKWFDPRNGGGLQNGTVTAVTGGSTVSLGDAPSSAASDWVVLVRLPVSTGTVTMIDLGAAKDLTVGTTWSDGLPAHAGADYIVPPTGNLRSENGTSIFPGTSLTIQADAKLQVRAKEGLGEVTTVSTLILTGGTSFATDAYVELAAGTGDHVTNVLNGAIALSGYTRFLTYRAYSGGDLFRSLKVQSTITGSGHIQAWEGSAGYGGERVIIDNAANTFSGTWEVGSGSTLIFNNAGAVGAADVEVLDDGHLKILGNWDTKAKLVVADTATATVELGAYHWFVTKVIFGRTILADGTYTVTEINALGANPVFAGSGSITVKARVAGPIAYWALDEGAGTIASDSTGNGYTGTIENGATWGRDATRDSYLSFDGTNDRVSTLFSYALSSTDDFAWACWANRAGTNDSGAIMVGNRYPQPGPGGETYEFIKLTPTTAQFANTSVVGSIDKYDYADITPDGWHHYAMVKTGTGYQWYVDGVAQGSPRTFGYGADAEIPFFIGGDDTAQTREFFNGAIDDVVLYDKALTPAEVVNVKNGIFDAPPEPVVLDFGVSGGNMAFSWSQGGFKLQTRTNLVAGNWVDYPGGNPSPVNVIPSNRVEFFRLIRE